MYVTRRNGIYWFSRKLPELAGRIIELPSEPKAT